MAAVGWVSGCSSGAVIGRASTDAGADASSTDAGVPPIAGRRLLAGSVALAGSGGDSCTHQQPAMGDRWCGYIATATDDPERFALWVINISRAIAGVPITCDGTDGNCLRLTNNVSLYSPNYPAFTGDTLIFSSDSITPGEDFTGPVFAWRPGWTAGRRLTANTGVLCFAHATAPVAYCFQNISRTTEQVSYDLVAGELPAAGGGTLPKIETMLVRASADPSDVRKFAVRLSPNGEDIAWSARPTATGAETLKTQKLNDDASRKTVAVDVSRWAISADSTKYYWLRGFNHDTAGAASGTLQMASFPDGAAQTTLITDVGEFGEVGSKGIVFRAGLRAGAGALNVMADRDNPATIKTFDTGVLAVWAIMPDGSGAIYSKTHDEPTELYDLHLTTVTAPSPCALVPEALSPGLASFSGGSIVSFGRYAAGTNRFDAFYAPVDTCRPQLLASDISRWESIGQEGYIWQDNTAAENLGVIRYSLFRDGSLLPGIPVALASPYYSVLLPSLPVIVYTIETNTERDGLYISDGLPFSTTD